MDDTVVKQAFPKHSLLIALLDAPYLILKYKMKKLNYKL